MVASIVEAHDWSITVAETHPGDLPQADMDADESDSLVGARFEIRGVDVVTEGDAGAEFDVEGRSST